MNIKDFAYSHREDAIVEVLRRAGHVQDSVDCVAFPRIDKWRPSDRRIGKPAQP
jgi:hypothetical protein